ncbi:cytochrome P450 2K1-like [Phascolarctos cinereus]
MGPKKVVVLSGYETVKDALVNYSEEFGERAHVPIFEKIFEGKGIVFSHGENWKIIRRFSLTTLRNFGMGKRPIEERIVEECQYLIQVFESHQGKPFDISTIMNASVTNIIVSILLGKRFDYQDPQFLRLLHLISENLRLAGSPGITEKDKPYDYFSNDNLVALVNNLFAAGTETTSSTLCWGILLMMKYPEIQKKVHNEITKVVAPAQPQTEHQTQMPYTDAVIHEIQRFSNILPMSVSRETTTDVIFKNYYIPKGTETIILLTSVLQDQTQWEKPYTFNPQHFLNKEGKFVKRDAFLPFSAGKMTLHLWDSVGKTKEL